MGFFPDEVITQILARLPVKWLYQAKTVCKLWCRLSSDRHFTQLYNELSARKPMVLVDISDSAESKSSLICVDNLRAVSEFSLDFMKDRVKVRASCNGLLCCSSIPDKGVYYVCNPITREYKLLPKSRERPMTELRRICPKRGVMVCDSLNSIDIIICQKVKRIPLCLGRENGQPFLPAIKVDIYNPKECWEWVEWENPDDKNVLLPSLQYRNHYYGHTWVNITYGSDLAFPFASTSFNFQLTSF